MSSKVLITILIILIANVNLIDVKQRHKEGGIALQEKHRCSRRFTAGVCLDNVTPVWTFEFQIMNCTERLGCPQSVRTNRFISYYSCMRRCQPLVDLYMQILTFGGTNDTRFFLRETPGVQIRRDGSVEVSFNVPSPPDPGEEEYSGDESILSNLMYGANDDRDYVNGDVDDVAEAHDPKHYFGYH